MINVLYRDVSPSLPPKPLPNRGEFPVQAPLKSVQRQNIAGLECGKWGPMRIAAYSV